MPAGDIPIPLSAWLTSTVGDFMPQRTIQATNRSSLWSIAAGREDLVVKAYAEDPPWRREVHAYQEWTKALGPVAPRLIQASSEHRSLVLEHRGGAPMKTLRVGASLDLSENQALGIYEAVGDLARRFRDAATGSWFGEVGPGGTPMSEPIADPIALMTADFRQWSVPALAECDLEPHERALAEWADTNLSAYADAPAVPVNTDYDTGNWLVHEGRLTGVIDFEYARWGVEDETFLPLWTRDYARLCPGAEDAFFAGYGVTRDEAAAVRKRVALIKQALVGIVCSVRWGTAAEVRAFRERLAAL